MATGRLARSAHITGADRDALVDALARRYAAGESIRSIAADLGRSYGFVQGLLKEAGVTLRTRGGATRGAQAVAARHARQEAVDAVRAELDAARAPEQKDSPSKPAMQGKKSKPATQDKKSKPATQDKKHDKKAKKAGLDKPGKHDKKSKHNTKDKKSKKDKPGKKHKKSDKDGASTKKDKKKA